MITMQCTYCGENVPIQQSQVEPEVLCPTCGERSPVRGTMAIPTECLSPASHAFAKQQLDQKRHDMAQCDTSCEQQDGAAGDERLFEALMSGATVTMAAHLAGISRRTAYRRLEDPAFRDRLEGARARVRDNIVQRLIDASGAAVDCLWELLENEDPALRLEAAKALLNTLAKIDRTATGSIRGSRSRHTRTQILTEEASEATAGL